MNSVLHRLRTLRVADVMARNVVEVEVDQPMRDVADLFVRRSISAAPVVDGDGQCVGVLSATDFLKRERSINGVKHCSGQESPTESPTESGDVAGEPYHSTGTAAPPDQVSAHMTRAVQTIPESALLLSAAKIMCSQHVHRLIVVDDEGRTAGVVSTMDVVAALMNAFEEVKTRM